MTLYNLFLIKYSLEHKKKILNFLNKLITYNELSLLIVISNRRKNGIVRFLEHCWNHLKIVRISYNFRIINYLVQYLTQYNN